MSVLTVAALFAQDKSCFNPPKKETVDLLAQNSGGDIRTAINGLQFSCMQGEDMKQPMVEIIHFFSKYVQSFL